jgi:toxin-antitoxin system PIN domain toxin
MRLIDVNLLVYAYHSGAPEHERCREWLRTILSRPEPVAFTLHTLLGFLRLSTSTAVFAEPFTIAEALRIVEEWLAMPQVVVLSPGERHWSILHELLLTSKATGGLVSDAHLAALAIEHGAVFFTSDRDFSRFAGLQWMNPLKA